MIPANLSPIADHLWQSTVFAAVAWLLTLALRKNRAEVRYWLWLAASLKFLISFSLLVALGSHLGWRAAPEAMQPEYSVLIEQFGQPFSTSVASVPHLLANFPPAPNRIPEVLFALWICGFLAVVFVWLVRWKGIRSAVRMASRLDIEAPIPALSSSSVLEPGVFGIWRPVLLLPEGITDCLTPAQLDAIVAHELCHVRRRDNLVAAVHMLVEAAFWFHPLVWWIGARLVNERERACDEAVLQSGVEPHIYAEGILNVCKFYLGSPLTCVSGVTGSNLKKRIREITRGDPRPNLNLGKTILLAALGLAAVLGPIIIGSANAPAAESSQAQTEKPSTPKFEVTSVKLHKSSDARKKLIGFLPGGRFVATNVPLIQVIAIAWDLPLNFLPQRLMLAPSVKMPDEIYDIEATAEEGTVPLTLMEKPRMLRMQPMLQALLKDRFHLRIRREPKEQPVYALVVGKGGPEKSKFQQEDCGDTGPNWISNPACHWLEGSPDAGIHGASVTIPQLVEALNSRTDRPLLDKTGLTGYYNIQTEAFLPMRLSMNGAAQPGDAGVNNLDRPTLPDVLEKVGLHMESQKAVIDMFVIDHVEKPSAN